MNYRSDFNFRRWDREHWLLTNTAGRYVFLTTEDFKDICQGNPKGEAKCILEQAGFFWDEDLEVYITEYSQSIQSYRTYLFAGTGLHIFCLTTSCNLACVYCQASTEISGSMMSIETARKSVDLALQSPNHFLSFEFQGGEPLLNFPVLKFIVEYAESKRGDRKIQYNLVSNLTALTDEMIQFFKEKNVSVSTSLDGPEYLQSINRPCRDGKPSYARWKAAYERLRKGTNCSVGAIQTTTRYSLQYPKEIVDQYITEGFSQVFLRPLTPLGYAAKRWNVIGYTAEEFLVFYRTAFNYILQRAVAGENISEGHASLFLRKIFGQNAGNYTELRSPCGAVLGQLAYNHDGKVYTCDEGRMMAEMGGYSFQVGTVDTALSDICNCDVCKAMLNASYLESLPGCSDCVYAPFCSVCPVVNYAEGGNLYPSSPNNYRCKIYKGMLDCIFEKLFEGNDNVIRVFEHWAFCR